MFVEGRVGVKEGWKGDIACEFRVAIRGCDYE